MKIEHLNIINGVKNEAFRNALISHGLGNESKAKEVLEAINRNPELKNSTEPRMTLYTAEINPYLYSDNSFIKKSVNDAAFAASGETKLLNDSNSGPTVTKGRFYPKSLAHGDNAPTQTVKVRKNLSNPWVIEYFHTEPDALTRELTAEVPYEARAELLKAHADIINQSIGNFTAVEWAQGEVGVAYTVDVTTGDNFFVFTSGATNRANGVVGTADQVKVITKADMQKVKKALQKQQIVGAGKMYFLPTVEQYDDLLNIEDFVNFEKTGNKSALLKGEVGFLYGMTILEPREREDWGANVLYSHTALVGSDTDLTKIEDTAASGASMLSAGMAWVETQVLRAEGSALVFPWLNSPIYLGDVYAVENRYGAIKKRNDKKGVVMLVESLSTW
jgi:hypothetical protein